MQSIPYPNNAPDEIWLLISEIFMFESVDGRTDGRTDGRRIESHTISSPWAFGSGELKILFSKMIKVCPTVL